MSEIQPLPQFPPQRAPQHDQQREQQRMGERMDDSCDDMPTVPIPARKVVTTFDAASRHERLEVKPPLTRLFRRTITKAFSVWLKFSTALVRSLDWYPRVEPYVGYGTEHYSRLICRIRPVQTAGRPPDSRHPWHADGAVPAYQSADRHR